AVLACLALTLLLLPLLHGRSTPLRHRFVRLISPLHNAFPLLLSLAMAIGCSLAAAAQMPSPSWLFCFPPAAPPHAALFSFGPFCKGTPQHELSASHVLAERRREKLNERFIVLRSLVPCGHKSLLQSDALYEYILETSMYPQEPESMRELREISAKHPWNIMTTSADEGQFLSLLLKLIGAKNTMEIGVYTGYTLLATALTLPDDGKIIAMDINRENYELALPVIQKAGIAHKIDFREGPALPVLDQMLEDPKNHGSFDFEIYQLPVGDDITICGRVS
ncbi:hypothetical protein Taro_027200, partial [Colocasia esculenta]|nr:hypothetical protein [Colocasia esculenta]